MPIEQDSNLTNAFLRPMIIAAITVLYAGLAQATEHRITPQTDLKPVLKQVLPGDSIELADGVWKDVELRFESLAGTADHPIHIRAQTPGQVVLQGDVRFRLSGKHVIVSGMHFRNPSDTSDVFEFRTHSDRHARDCRITDCVFDQTESGSKKESRWLNVYGVGNRVDHCYFAGKRNRGTTLVVWVAETPGDHRIDHNHFGPRPELGQNGGETIRIGTSEVSEMNCRTVIEENYFERCDGEAEIISNKSCENVYRHNLFDQCSGALTLRHGHRCTVDGNVFFGKKHNGTGGVRIIGQDHRVTNNYFEGLRGDAERAAISVMNGIPESPLNGYAPVRNALIAHNTFIDCKVSIEFGVRASKTVSVAPLECRVSHNLFLPGKWQLFRVQADPVRFNWIGNRLQSGKVRDADLVQITQTDVKLVRAKDGTLRPAVSKPLETDELSEIQTDIDGHSRQIKIAGCDDPNTPLNDRDLQRRSGPSWRQ